MPKKYYYLLIIPIISFIIVVGLGIWSLSKKNTSPPNSHTTGASGAMQPYLYPEDEVLDTTAQKKALLNEAIKRFRNAKTFRANIIQTQGKTKQTGTLEYVKPLRLHVTMEAQDKSKLESIIVGETAYVFDKDNKWKMTNDKNIKDFGHKLLEAYLTKDETLASFGVDTDAQIDIQDNKSKECTEFRAPYKTDQGTFELVICVNENKDISFINMQTQDGALLIEYKDYNALFNIERPMLPLLEPRFELATSTGI